MALEIEMDNTRLRTDLIDIVRGRMAGLQRPDWNFMGIQKIPKMEWPEGKYPEYVFDDVADMNTFILGVDLASGPSQTKILGRSYDYVIWDEIHNVEPVPLKAADVAVLKAVKIKQSNIPGQYGAAHWMAHDE